MSKTIPFNRIGDSITDRSEIAAHYGNRRKKSFAELVYNKTSKVISKPQKWASTLRSQMSKDVFPFVTVNQLLKQLQIAEKKGDEARAQGIEDVLAEMISQERTDGFTGTDALCIQFLKAHVAVGRLMAADIEKVYHQYVVSFKDDPFIHIPKVIEARKVAENLASEDRDAADIYADMDQKLVYVCSQEREAGQVGSDAELLEALHGTEG